MNIDQAGYPYVKKDNGSHHRLSRAGKNLIQKGGATTEEVDAGFADPDARNRLLFQGGRWEHEYDSWYEKLQATPDYLVEKCEAKKRATPKIQEFLRSPLGTTAYHPKPLREPRPDEILGDRVNDPNLDADIRRKIEAYDAEANRGGERKVYQNCKLAVPEDRLPILEKVKCSEHVCRDNSQIVRRMNDQEDLEGIIEGPLSAKEKDKYLHCASKNLYCRNVEYAEVNITKGPFKHITNAGSGECLFIAIAQYIKFANALDQNGPIFPVPVQDQPVPAEKYKALRAWMEGSKMAYEAGNVLRQRAVDWLESNGEEFLTGPEGRTIKEAMALSLVTSTDSSVISQILSPIGTNITRVHNGFITLFPRYAEIMNIEPIKGPKDIGKKIKLIANIITDRDTLIVNDDTDMVRGAIDALMDYYAGFYTKSLREPNTYAGPLEIFAMSKILDTNIHVWAIMANKNRYYRLTYMSYNTITDTDKTINLLLSLEMNSKGLVRSGVQHFEILFPWARGVPEPPRINTYESLVKAFPQALTLDPISIEQVEIFVHSLFDLSLTKESAFDKLVERHSDAFLTWLIELIWECSARLNIATIVNGLFRMITRNVPYSSSMEERLDRTDHLTKISDKDLRLALRDLIINLLDIDASKITPYVKGFSVHNQILADAIIGLKIPNKTIAESAKYNISTLISYLQSLDTLTASQELVLETLRINLIVLVICKFTSDMYYYKDRREYFGLNIEPGSTDLEVMSLLKHYLLMNEIISFDGKVNIPARAQGLGYRMDTPSISEDSKWRGSREDITFIKSMNDAETMAEVIRNMNTMGLAHTRSNYELILSIMT